MIHCISGGKDLEPYSTGIEPRHWDQNLLSQITRPPLVFNLLLYNFNFFIGIVWQKDNFQFSHNKKKWRQTIMEKDGTFFVELNLGDA